MSKKRNKKRSKGGVMAKKNNPADIAALFSSDKKKVLHVGCGQKKNGKSRLHERFTGDEWQEIRLDIDPDVKPDIVSDILDMHMLEDNCVDALFSSHNVERLYAHQVGQALSEFYRVLRPGGYALITLPDAQIAARYVAEGNITGKIYDSPAGPISALDILYGHREALKCGHEYMGHKTAFTARTLGMYMRDAGFCNIKVQRQYRDFDLISIGYKLAHDHPKYNHKITIIDRECGASGMRDDLDMPPRKWKPLGLKQAATQEQ